MIKMKKIYDSVSSWEVALLKGSRSSWNGLIEAFAGRRFRQLSDRFTFYPRS